MDLLKELLSDWVGLLSLITILAVVAMAAYYGWLFSRKVEEDTAAHAAAAPKARRRGGA
ncbi:MAG: hypothetical protein RIS59_346 [Pseudomonadota bacterium]|jgi:flagellar basal body-associated protein FliL